MSSTLKTRVLEALVKHKDERFEGSTVQAFTKEVWEKVVSPHLKDTTTEDSKPAIFQDVLINHFYESFKGWKQKGVPENPSKEAYPIVAARYLISVTFPDEFKKLEDTLAWYSIEWPNEWDKLFNAPIPEDLEQHPDESEKPKGRSRKLWVSLIMFIVAVCCFSLYKTYYSNRIPTSEVSGTWKAILEKLKFDTTEIKSTKRGSFDALNELLSLDAESQKKTLLFTSDRIDKNIFIDLKRKQIGKTHILEFLIASDTSIGAIRNKNHLQNTILVSRLTSLICKDSGHQDDDFHFYELYHGGGTRSATASIVKKTLLLPNGCPDILSDDSPGNSGRVGIGKLHELVANDTKGIAITRRFLSRDNKMVTPLTIIDDSSNKPITFPATGLYIYVFSDENWSIPSRSVRFLKKMLSDDVQKKLQKIGLSVDSIGAQGQIEQLKKIPMEKTSKNDEDILNNGNVIIRRFSVRRE